MKLRLMLTFIFVFNFSICSSSLAATIYVDQVTGDDSNNGLTANTAVATITRGETLVVAGDTLIIGPGIYSASNGEVLPVVFSGGINLLGAGPDQTILDGESSTTVLAMAGTDAQINIDGLAVVNGFDSEFGTGAGIRIGTIEQLNLSNCLIENNNGNIGSGLMISDTPEISVVNCHFIGNQAAIGGAMQIQINGDLDVVMDVSNSIFRNNTAQLGSAIQFQQNGNGRHTLNIDQSQFINNNVSAVSYARNNGTSVGQITNSVFADNPGVALSAGSSEVDVVNVTFVNNQQALSVGDQSQVVNSIFWDNEMALIGTAQSSVSFSIVQALDYDDLTDGGGNFDANPLLDSSYRLDMNSPAIDRGSDQAVDELGLTEDFEQQKRKATYLNLNRTEGVVDIGADEIQDIIFADDFDF